MNFICGDCGSGVHTNCTALQCDCQHRAKKNKEVA